MKFVASMVAGLVLSNAALAAEEGSLIDTEQFYETIRTELKYTPDAAQVSDSLRKQLERVGYSGEALGVEQSFKSSFEQMTADAPRYIAMAR